MNVCGILNWAFSIPLHGSRLLPNVCVSKQLLRGERAFMTFFLSLDFYKGQEKLDENFMWLKKLSLLNFNKKVATAKAYF